MLWFARQAKCLQEMQSKKCFKRLKGQATKIIKQHTFHVLNRRQCCIYAQFRLWCSRQIKKKKKHGKLCLGNP